MKNVSNQKTNTLSGFFWKFLERIGSQIVSFIVSIIIARILTPDDYGLVSLITIFFTFANIFIVGGFNTALIQKQKCDVHDYSTIFIFSIFVSLICYLILFFISPHIADFFGQPILKNMIRVMGLILPVNAIQSIWAAHISIQLEFKKFFFSSLIGIIFSAIIGIAMGVLGFGPWALVAQQMTNILVGTVALVLSTKLNLSFKFSLNRFKKLFSYGWKVLLSSLIANIYSEIVPLFIGKKYTKEELSFYTKGRSFPNLINSSITSTISSVLFPVLSRYKENKTQLLYYTRKFIRVISYITFPLMIGLCVVAEKFVLVLLTEKWLSSVIYIQIFCIATMFDVVHIGNCETIKAVGKSGTYLVMEIIKKACYFVIIAVFLWLFNSPQQLALAFVFCTIVALVVNSIPNNKIIGYTFKMQIIDLLPNLFSSVLMGIIVYLFGLIKINIYLSFVLQILIGIFIYVLLSVLFQNSSFKYLWNKLKNLTITGEARDENN